MKKIILSIGFLFAVPLFSFATTPSVTSFTTGSPSINSWQYASFSWTFPDAYGYSFIIPCTQSITLRKLDGTAFPCDTPVTSTTLSADTIDLAVWNISASTKTFTARIIPKDISGNDYTPAQRDLQVSVAPMQHPIENITGSTTIPSLIPYTFSWKSNIIDAVNLSLSCSSAIHTSLIHSQVTTLVQPELPCDTFLFPNGLPASGSATLSFKNTDMSARDITLIVTPMMAPGLYNGMQTERITVSVDPYTTPKAQTTSFIASTTQNVTDATLVPFSWETSGSTGANIRVSCNEHLSSVITTDSASSTPSCTMIAFSSPLSPQGTGTIAFLNNSSTVQPITLTLLPLLAGGGYDGTAGKELSFRILPKGAVIASTPSVTLNSLLETRGNTSPQETTSPKKLFTKNLVRGMSGSEISAVQAFFKKDTTVYPEGIVNGIFGPATERAVKRFQIKYDVANAKNPGYGMIGPKTRASMNSVNN